MSQTTREETHLRHPFSKEKLKIVDKFEAIIKPCSACNHEKQTMVMLVEGDVPAIKNYAVLHCSACQNHDWYVLQAKS